jgi:two-component system response regulator PilR (NtrC family)/two-component system KDP operon response regulator KdpE
MSVVKKILIVDDEADICYLLSHMLKEKQYITQCANTLAEAGTMLQDCPPFLIFLDIHLPDGSGLQWIERTKKLIPTPILVLMSAYDNAAERKEGLRRGADFFIAKPFTHNDICKVLDKFFPEM